jgi:lipid II:glycine glycyltransferase (peptidoglycan interpeptide bridge formation enzyme)
MPIRDHGALLARLAERYTAHAPRSADLQQRAAAVMVDFGRVRTYLFGGSSDRHREAMAPHLLHFTAILEAKAKGLQGYDFWGLETASGKTAGFVRFKQGFAPQAGPESSGGGVKEYAGAYDFACQPLSYRAYQGLRLINRLAR